MGSQANIEPGSARWLAVTVRFGGSPRTFVPQGWAAASLAAALAATVAWALGASLYLVFHDQLLASLMERQALAQYAYEERISGLSMQLDQQTSRALVDRHTLETTVRELQERSARLAARAALIDRLVARPASLLAQGGTPSGVRGPSPGRNPLLAPVPAAPVGVSAYAEPDQPRARAEGFEGAPLRLESKRFDEAEPPPSKADADKRAEIGMPAEQARAIAVDLANAEQDQDRALAALREPALRLVAKLKTALADVGIAAGAARASEVGGPFVPLTVSALTFEQGAAMVQDALLQAAQLTALAERVPLRQPVAGTLEVTSTFGPRLDPFFGRPAMHTGVDFRGGYGTAVHATAAGTVTLAAAEGGYGTMVEVNHGNGLATRYAHLSSASVTPGQHVEAGALVGQVGSSGRATGPHLHYETRINGEAVDPVRFLKAGARLFQPS